MTVKLKTQYFHNTDIFHYLFFFLFPNSVKRLSPFPPSFLTTNYIKACVCGVRRKYSTNVRGGGRVRVRCSVVWCYVMLRYVFILPSISQSLSCIVSHSLGWRTIIIGRCCCFLCVCFFKVSTLSLSPALHLFLHSSFLPVIPVSLLCTNSVN